MVPRIRWYHQMLLRLEIDTAVFFSIAQRVWQFIAGPITLILIGRYFSPEVQGYYYTFWSVLALQVYFELALPQTIITMASYQWRDLQLSSNRGIIGAADALSRLAYLTRVTTITFASTAYAFSVAIGALGYWFFSQDASSQLVSWEMPWFALIALTAMTFVTTPLLSILEGCNCVGDIYRIQFIRSFLGNLVIWVAILVGGGLWIPAIATFVRLACEIGFLWIYYRRFFYTLYVDRGTAAIDWRSEVWPFQSRVLLKGLFSYFHSDFMGPVLFHYHGAIWAGQLGLTWQVLNSLRTACASWVRVRYARMGTLAAGGQYQEMDRIFHRSAIIGWSVMALGATLFWLLICLLPTIDSRIAQRLLPSTPTALLIVGLMAALTIEFLWTYIHSFRVSPYLAFTLGGLILSGFLMWWWGSVYGRTGVAFAYCTIQAGLFLPMSIRAWYQIRKSIQLKQHA